MDALTPQPTNHPVLNIVLGSIATVTMATGMNLEAITMEDLKYYDMIFALVLKAISIVSFIVLTAINIDKLMDRFKSWFGPKGKKT